MEWLLDPTIWVGLLTLVILEIVLGIDNLIFIAILADKLPPAERACAHHRSFARAHHAIGLAGRDVLACAANRTLACGGSD